MEIIITEQDIINTYDKRQQEQCRLFYQYKKIKAENSDFGYKRIAKIMGYKCGKTRWWHCGKHIPTPIQTADWLKEKGLLPLNYEHPKEFGEDLKKLFGDEIEENSRIIEGGVYGHSWCYQNTNRNIIRFFIALDAPVGDKSFIKLKVPAWMKKSEESIQDEFFGSLFGAEMGVPKVHINKNRLDTLSLGITGKDELAENRIDFLTEVANYLNNKGIFTGKISINDHKKCNRKGEPTKIYRLLISTTFLEFLTFAYKGKISSQYQPQFRLFSG